MPGRLSFERNLLVLDFGTMLSFDDPRWTQARNQGGNPNVPPWSCESYFGAIRELAEIGSREIMTASDPDTVRSILDVLAIEKGLRTHGRFLINYSDDELLEMESR